MESDHARLVDRIESMVEHAGGRAKHIVTLLRENPVLPRVEGHPLGMTAARFGYGDREIRLHIWDRTTGADRDSLGSIHDHTWHLESYVLEGSLINSLLSVRCEAVDDDAEQNRVWVHDYSRGVIELTPVVGTIVERTTQEWGAGSVYSVAAGTFHEATTPARTITLVVAKPSGRQVARILAPKNGHSNGMRRQVPLSEAVDLLTES